MNLLLLFFVDDKHRCKVGELGLPVAAVERGKCVVVTTSGKKFAVSDHDFTRFSIIPIVLSCTVIVQMMLRSLSIMAKCMLDSKIQLSKLLFQQQISSPILVLFTDGGPDHNNTFLSVQLGLIALFLHAGISQNCIISIVEKPMRVGSFDFKFRATGYWSNASSHGDEI